MTFKYFLHSSIEDWIHRVDTDESKDRLRLLEKHSSFLGVTPPTAPKRIWQYELSSRAHVFLSIKDPELIKILESLNAETSA